MKKMLRKTLDSTSCTSVPDVLREVALITLVSIVWCVVLYGVVAFGTFKLNPLTWSATTLNFCLFLSLLIPLYLCVFCIAEDYVREESVRVKTAKLGCAGVLFLLLEFLCFSLYFWSIDTTTWGYAREAYYCTLYLSFCCSATAIFMLPPRKSKKLFFTAISLCFVGLSYLIFAGYLQNLNVSEWSSSVRFFYFGTTLLGLSISSMLAYIEKDNEKERRQKKD